MAFNVVQLVPNGLYKVCVFILTHSILFSGLPDSISNDDFFSLLLTVGINMAKNLSFQIFCCKLDNPTLGSLMLIYVRHLRNS